MNLKSALQKRIVEKLYDLVDMKAAPGFQLSLGCRDRTLGVFAAGYRDPVHKRSLYEMSFMDLSSLTKVISTCSLLMFAVQQQLIADLETPLKNWFPFLVSDLKNRNLHELLHHRAGLPPIFEKTEELLGGRDEKQKFFLQSLDESYDDSNLGKEIYSDVGFMILGLVLERVFAKRLSQIFSDFFPLDSGLMYGPLNFKWDSWSWLLPVPTLASCLSLSEPPVWLRGRVQDPRAAWFEGDAGHAGLFGTAQGVEAWGKELYLSYHGKGLRLSDKTVRRFINFELKTGRFLGGFDTPTSTETSISQAGFHAGSTTVGHLGYTGCSVWMDMEKGYRVCLLSHRHQPGGRPEKLSNFRPGFHDWLYEEVFSRLES